MKHIRYMTWRECAEIFEKYGVNSKEAEEVLGMSPGGAGPALGVTRQRTHQLVRDGKLDMVMLRDGPGAPVSAWIITEASMKRYRLSKGGVQQDLPLGKSRAKIGPRSSKRQKATA